MNKMEREIELSLYHSYLSDANFTWHCTMSMGDKVMILQLDGQLERIRFCYLPNCNSQSLTFSPNEREDDQEENAV